MFIHRYMHNKNTQIVNEDWGYALARIGFFAGTIGLAAATGGALGAVGAPIAGAAIGTAGGIAVTKTLEAITMRNVKKVLADPKVKKFIAAECEKAFKAAVKENKDFVVKLAPADFDPAKETTALKKVEDPNKKVGSASRFFKSAGVMFTLDKYRLYIEGDSNTIKSISLTLTKVNKKGGRLNILFKTLPTPSTKDIKDYFAD